MDDIIKAILSNDLINANKLSKEKYPFKLVTKEKRIISKKDMLKVFIRDGFIDRYSGDKLFHPGFLRALNLLLPESFCYQQHGKAEECHDIFWSKMPSIDHFIPIYSGGENNFSNWITTSMRRNLAKNNSTLEEIGWTLYEAGEFKDWDGYTKNFIDLYEKFEEKLKDNKYVNSWYLTTKKTLKDNDFLTH